VGDVVCPVQLAAQKVVVGEFACPVQPVLADSATTSPTDSNGRTPTAARLSCRRPICFDTPSQEVSRGVPGTGLVARFINLAPHRLQAGSDAATPPAESGSDWWAEGVSVELRPCQRPSPSQRPSAAADRDTPGHVLDLTDEVTQCLAAENEEVPNIQTQLEEAVCVHLVTPIVRGGPRLRRSKTPVSIGPLRRSGRLAAKPRAPNPVVQAHRVLLSKLGVQVPEEASHEQLEGVIAEAFRGGLTARKKNALQNFLEDKVDLAAMDLDLTGLDGGVS